MKSSRRDSLVITEPLKTVSYRGVGVRWEEGAFPGVYKAEREDSGGVYYYGPGRSIWQVWPVGRIENRLYVGGIYIPHDIAKAPRFFYFVERQPQLAADLEKYTVERVAATAAMPAPGFGVGPNVVGHVVAAALIEGAAELEVGKIITLPEIEDSIVRQKILASRKAGWPTGAPNTLEEAFAALDNDMPAIERQKFRGAPEREAVIQAHMGMGRYIRNKWFRAGGSELPGLLQVQHFDDASSIVLTSYWRHLDGKPLDVESQVTCYRSWWQEQERLAAEAKAKGTAIHGTPAFSCP